MGIMGNFQVLSGPPHAIATFKFLVCNTFKLRLLFFYSREQRERASFPSNSTSWPLNLAVEWVLDGCYGHLKWHQWHGVREKEKIRNLISTFQFLANDFRFYFPRSRMRGRIQGFKSRPVIYRQAATTDGHAITII